MVEGKNTTPVFLGRYSKDNLEIVADKIISYIKKSNPFILWMEAPMGAGKTTLTGVILKKLGLNPNYPVLSPTYTYINEYLINNRYYAHLDLYRISSYSTLEDLGVNYKDYSGFIIEWPSTCKISDYLDLKPTHILNIKYTENEDAREFYIQVT